ncbi:Oxidoreductase, aldo/keto reductase family protein [Aphelenchoides fujianensis]|nr:Oxidoreductase, aldo/keto reductase family protein [Aphelenchoides fujianensis]
MSEDEYHVTLSNGLKFPLLGYGSTWLSTDPEKLKASLRVALDTGYRYIDTASLYNNEHIIGEVLQEYYDAGKLKREEVFIASKLPSQGHHKEGEQRKMRPIHSNKLFRRRIELHIYHRRRDLVDLCKKLNISVTSYATLGKQLHFVHFFLMAASLGSPGRFEDLKKLAPNRQFPDKDLLHHPLLADKHKKTAAQVLLRHLIQLKISVIPKSLTKERIQENFDIFDFRLTKDEMDRFDTEIKEDIKFFEYIHVRTHPFFPPY